MTVVRQYRTDQKTETQRTTLLFAARVTEGLALRYCFMVSFRDEIPHSVRSFAAHRSLRSLLH
ncbi:hypothetical protein C443_08898 [Haloarcula argentinensis DSM 12282]|nr:hypothetical protein C443_08898 [Haloarcula argentinensis DSM 12282]